MIYLIRYGKTRFPREYHTDRNYAQQRVDYYMQHGYKKVTLKAVSDPDRIRTIANRWVAMWGRSDIEDIRKQRERQAQEIRKIADNLEVKQDEGLSLLNPTAVNRAESHMEYVNSGAVFG